MERHYRINEVAAMTGFAVATIRKKVSRREIGYHKKVRAVLIPESEVRKLLGDYRPPVTAA
jgi:excisionase family DNA binding protein